MVLLRVLRAVLVRSRIIATATQDPVLAHPSALPVQAGPADKAAPGGVVARVGAFVRRDTDRFDRDAMGVNAAARAVKHGNDFTGIGVRVSPNRWQSRIQGGPAVVFNRYFEPVVGVAEPAQGKYPTA